MSGDVRMVYNNFIDATSRHLPNVDPLLIAVITQYEDSQGIGVPKEVRTTIKYHMGTALQKGIDEADKINASLESIGIIPYKGDSKTNKLHVTMPINLETLFKLQKDKDIESIELNL